MELMFYSFLTFFHILKTVPIIFNIRAIRLLVQRCLAFGLRFCAFDYKYIVVERSNSLRTGVERNSWNRDNYYEY